MEAYLCRQIFANDSVKEPQVVVKDRLHMKQFMQSLQNTPSSTSSSCRIDSSKSCLQSVNCRVPRIRSPSCASSDLEEAVSHCGTSSRSHSDATTPSKSSPERFLVLDSEDSDCEEVSVIINSNQNNCSATFVSQKCQYRGIPHKGKQLRVSSGRGVSSFSGVGAQQRRRNSSGNSSSVDEGGATESSSLQIFGECTVCVRVCVCFTLCVCVPAVLQYVLYSIPLQGEPVTRLISFLPFLLPGPKHQIVKATKLRHYAKTTSPSSLTHKKPSPLLVSILLSSLPASGTTTPTTPASNKPRKPTALSHFATKKRALSRSPSVCSSQDTSPFSSCTPPALRNGSSELGVRSKGSGTISKGAGKMARPPTKGGRSGGRFSAALQADQDGNTDVPVETEPCSDTTTSGKVLDPSLMGNGLHYIPSGAEDDEMSIASSITTSSSGNSVTAGNKTAGKGTGRRKKSSQSSMLRIATDFSLNSLFSYYPPTLTIRDGELVPEKSLSVKNLNRSSLPSSHPLDRWSLGQPVRGTPPGGLAVPKSKRARKNASQSGKA